MKDMVRVRKSHRTRLSDANQEVPRTVSVPSGSSVVKTSTVSTSETIVKRQAAAHAAAGGVASSNRSDSHPSRHDEDEDR